MKTRKLICFALAAVMMLCAVPALAAGNSGWNSSPRYVPENALEMTLSTAMVTKANSTLRVTFTNNSKYTNYSFGDAFTLEASIAELKRKPSKPIGKSGMNAFGESVEFEDRGEMLRAILAIGRQDTDPNGLTPLDEGAEILGASSDHLIVDLTHAKGSFAVGDVLRFGVNYGALLNVYSSVYVDKIYIY